ncbi:cell wall-binding repeat-containing protein [Guptibacillus hwajinpoensis]|uniref:Lactocepin n=1 Tax=Guptibacillus hwajinpoensis TaxID=208199 RepID=A0ABU0JZ76_9BACL|nr:cell wall-binding repeat-containing protein [Alkalihalobacillus hemicentroti]MDQ0482420.1 lactocepin [Alkalihalobacillus hemicentroti]
MRKTFGMLYTVILAGSLIGATAVSASTQNSFAQRAQSVTMNGNNDLDFMYEEEPNNSIAQANLLENGDTVTGKLTNNDKDYYRLVIEEDREVYLNFNADTNESESSLKLHVDMYNSSQERITLDLDYDSDESEAFIRELSPGTYYFAVSDLANKNNGVEYHFTAYAYTGAPVITRISGVDRYETAVEIAKYNFEKGNTPEVVLATGLDFPDALVGSPLAFQIDAPILLTKANSIPDSVKKALTYFGVEHVTIIGGHNAVSKNVESTLTKMNIKFDRIAGANRYDTASRIASKLDSTASETAFVTYGGNFPDALSVASIAASQGSPILLTKTKELPIETSKALKNYNNTFAIGGTTVISDAVLKKLPTARRIAGKDRYETSVQVIKQLDVPSDFAAIATGETFADALTGSTVFKPIVLTRKASLPTPTANLFQENDTEVYTILGGKQAVGEDVEEDIRMLFK